jgi:hypothetical protein
MSTYNIDWYAYEAKKQKGEVKFNIYPVQKNANFELPHKKLKTDNMWSTYDQKEREHEAMLTELLNQYIW